MDDAVRRSPLTWKKGLFGLVVLLLLAVVALAAGKAVLEKLLTDLVMPAGLVWLTLSGLAVLLAVRRNAAFKWAALAWFVFTLAGNGFVADFMVGTLEQRYVNVQPLDRAPLKQVAVLGGGTGQAANGQVQVTGSGDRVVLAARMYHSGLAGKIICTGTGIEGLHGQQVVAGEAARRILIDLSVPADAIEVIGGRNTSEEMQALKRSVGTEPVGIITSAWHLNRAIRLADKQGLQAIPLPADFLSQLPGQPQPWGSILRGCIPNAGALQTNSRVLKEYLARLVGR